MSAPGLRQSALACLLAADPDDKLARTANTADLIAQDALELEATLHVRRIEVPGRPPRPPLVPPPELEQRKLGTPEGRAALLHAVAHIEFNAINLAWDAVYRFGGMPADYYRDWASVAADEARHFALLRARLAELGHAYGDFPAHNGLWEMALATDRDALERMALVPRLLEARGLDVTPAMIERLKRVGDFASVAVLERILREEVRHVAIGTRWFRHCCAERGLDPDRCFAALLERHGRSRIRGPFNWSARRAAAFSTAELDFLATIDPR